MLLQTDQEILEFRNSILKELSGLNGSPWKEVYCEVHSQYNEVVFWILLYNDNELTETHRAFYAAMSIHVDTMFPLQAAVSYFRYVEGNLFRIASMEGNSVIISRAGDEQLNERQIPSDWCTVVFRSNNSKR